jgi:hypothetical protein
MKKLLTLFLVAAGLSTGAYGQKHTGDAVPAAVKEAFTKQFSSTDARWEKLGDQYGAYFKQRRLEMSAVYAGDGTLTETGQEIKVSQLPRPVVEYVVQHYRGSKITEATKITKANGEINYKACIKGRDMLFDASCTYLTEKGQPLTKF